jgi:hypothetical protein
LAGDAQQTFPAWCLRDTMPVSFWASEKTLQFSPAIIGIGAMTKAEHER